MRSCLLILLASLLALVAPPSALLADPLDPVVRLLLAPEWTIDALSIDQDPQAAFSAATLVLEGDRYLIFTAHGELLDHGKFKHRGARVQFRNRQGLYDVAVRPGAGEALHLQGTLALAIAPLLDFKAAISPVLEPSERKPPATLLKAAELGDVSALERRLKAGERAGKRDREGNTALMIAAMFCHPAAVTFLLQHGASAHDRHPVNGDTPLLRAASCGDEDTVRAVLAAKPDVNAHRSDGTTALMQIIRGGELGAAQALVAAGADLRARDPFGLTLLHAAAGGQGMADRPCPELVRWLVAQQVDVNARDLGHKTPVMYAIMGHQRDSLRILLAAGADATLRDFGNSDASAYARQLAPELLPLLERHTDVVMSPTGDD